MTTPDPADQPIRLPITPKTVKPQGTSVVLDVPDTWGQWQVEAPPHPVPAEGTLLIWASGDSIRGVGEEGGPLWFYETAEEHQARFAAIIADQQRETRERYEASLAQLDAWIDALPAPFAERVLTLRAATSTPESFVGYEVSVLRAAVLHRDHLAGRLTAEELSAQVDAVIDSGHQHDCALIFGTLLAEYDKDPRTLWSILAVPPCLLPFSTLEKAYSPRLAQIYRADDLSEAGRAAVQRSVIVHPAPMTRAAHDALVGRLGNLISPLATQLRRGAYLRLVAGEAPTGT